MATEGYKRKLAAILAADVKGYSRLMGEDEEATLRTLTAYRNAMSDLVQQYRGRVVDALADRLLAEFTSVVDAVNCSVEIQRDLAERNADLPDERKMEFRIGVNLGDVIEEDKRIYGDGVNIAARVESLAEPGGICISGTVYDSIQQRLGLEYEYLGEQEVKNIVQPVRVYRVLSLPGAEAPIEPASVDQMAYPLPDKPSIAVLPFTNMSGDPEQEYFAHGMADDIITDLSKIAGLFVIARNSSFKYKGETVDIKQASRELGIRYVLEGSVRKVDQQVRINAQLIDAINGNHLWAERYDGSLGDVFALQDEITHKIVSALEVKLTEKEREHVARKETDSIEAYDTFLKGWRHQPLWTTDDIPKAIMYYEKAIELDPNYGRVYAELAHIYQTAPGGWLGLRPDKARKKAREYLSKAMKNPTAYAHMAAANIKSFLAMHKEAVAEIERALSLAPNDPSIHGRAALIFIYAGRPKEAIDFIEFEMRHDPSRIGFSLLNLGMAYFCLGELEKAVTFFERSRSHLPEEPDVFSYLVATYANLGRIQEARAELEEHTKTGGDLITLRLWMSFLPFNDPDVAERFANGLLKAGIVGEPSGYYKVYEKNRLTGKEIEELLSGSEAGEWWIEGDTLCSDLKWFDGYGLPVFRNPDGTPEDNNEYLVKTDIGGGIAFNTISGLYQELKPVSIKEEAGDLQIVKWNSDADGIGKDGVFTRKNPPAFSFKYPANFIIHELQLGETFHAVSSNGLPHFVIVIYKITGETKEHLSEAVEGSKELLQKYGTDIKIIYNKSLPPDTYGVDHLAQEYEIDFKYGGAMPLKIYNNAIVKEDYFIILYWTIPPGAIEKDMAKIKALFKTIDLEP